MDYFTSITDPRWANENGTVISFQITLNGKTEPEPAIVGVEDPTDCAQTLWARFVAGEWGPIADWDPVISNWDSIIAPPPAPQFLEIPVVTFVDGLLAD